MDNDHLYLLINEDIYLIDEAKSSDQEATEHPTDLQEPSEKIDSKAIVETSEEETKELTTKNEGETPLAPKEPTPQTITPIAIFHTTSSESDLTLLGKIIAACKIEEGNYQIYSNGFDKGIKFQKAIVFVEKSKAFYEPIPYLESEILCSKPLHLIATDQQEKAKLWSALQEFV